MDTQRRCSTCHQVKAIDAFNRRRNGPGGIHTMCRQCLSASNQAYREANRERLLEAKRQRWRNLSEEARATEAARQKAWHVAHRENALQAAKARRLSQKLAALRHYGPACSCCGELDSRFLGIEHTRGDGAEHRRVLFGSRSSSASFYDWLQANGYPDDLGLAVMCGSCNQTSHRFGGVCPHGDDARQYLTTTDPAHIAARVKWLEGQLERQRSSLALAVGANTTQS